MNASSTIITERYRGVVGVISGAKALWIREKENFGIQRVDELTRRECTDAFLVTPRKHLLRKLVGDKFDAAGGESRPLRERHVASS